MTEDAYARLFTKGRYRHGQPAGRWRYSTPTGSLARQERYHRHGLSDITYYYPNGQAAFLLVWRVA